MEGYILSKTVTKVSILHNTSESYKHTDNKTILYC